MYRAVAAPRFLLLITLSACATPIHLDYPAESRVASVSADTPALGSDSITIQVRSFSYSPSVTVLAWPSADPDYGLRARLRSDGSLVGDHVIYVSTTYQPGMPRFPRARIPSRPLEASSGTRDEHACHFGECSPLVSIGAQIPDHVLREVHESMPVRFYENVADRRGHPLLTAPEPQGGQAELTIVVEPALIAAYLAAVDSVSAQLRRARR